MLGKVTIDDIDVKGKRVLVRCDFNVPLNDKCEITDETRITAVLPTISKLVSEGAKVILCSHLGKPKGKVVETMSLAPVAKRLSELLGREVVFANDGTEVVGENARAAVEKMADGDVVLLENTRFSPEEEKNGEDLSKALASIADIYVNDAFGTAHRAHSSTAGVAELVGQTAVGYLMEKEINFLSLAVEEPVRPFVAILGGAKIDTKIPVIKNLLEKVDTLIIGGGMAYTFIKAKGGNVGKSMVDEERIDYAREMIETAAAKGVNLVLPVDSVVAKEFSNDVPFETVDIMNIPDDEMGLDIGEASVELFAKAIMTAKTIIWNGPMGVFEMSNFAQGTKAIAALLAESCATTIIGGGDSAAAVNQMGFGDKMTHISTGGGASLELLEGKLLPGIAVIRDKTE